MVVGIGSCHCCVAPLKLPGAVFGPPGTTGAVVCHVGSQAPISATTVVSFGAAAGGRRGVR
eukprot:3423131-Alexandrium_andersonii.AAC.1